jgi:hypothetical protein
MHPMIHLWIQERLPLQLRSQYTREALVVLNRACKELRTDKARMVWQISAVTDNVKQYRSDYKNRISYRETKLYTTNNWFGRGLFSTYSFYLRLHAVVEDILVWATKDSYLSRVDDWALLYDFGSIYRSLDMYQHAESLYTFCLYEILKTKLIFHPSSWLSMATGHG